MSLDPPVFLPWVITVVWGTSETTYLILQTIKHVVEQLVNGIASSVLVVAIIRVMAMSKRGVYMYIGL